MKNIKQSNIIMKLFNREENPMEILDKTFNQMPRIFTSYQFNNAVKKNGYPSTLLEGRGLSKFLHNYANNSGENSKLWTKMGTEVTETLPVVPVVVVKKMTDTDELNQKYLEALKVIHQGLMYSDKINLAEVINDFGLSKDVYKPLQDSGIIKTNGRAASACRYTWTTTEPSIEMAIELRDNLNKNSVKRKPKETPMPTEALKPKSTSPRKLKTQPKKIVKSYFWGLFTTTSVES
tara:strand:- start:17306 stop:18010 length:705 start_codon:yes stop_codon:yes gene_type:complete